VHAENYMGGGQTLSQLETLRALWPISVHGIGLSLGSADGLDGRHLDRLRGLVERIDPLLVSDHLSWSVEGGTYLNDLLPLPYTEEALLVVATNVDAAQTRLRRRLLIENPSAYLRFAQSTIPEHEFLGELARRTGCGLLCDVNNIYVTTRNLGGDPIEWLAALPADRVEEIHLAGHCVNDADGQSILIDDHGSRVAPAVWGLFDRATQLFPEAVPLIEWDTDLPELAVLIDEAETANRRRRNALSEEPRDVVAA
jgi:uncharacterized protein